MKIAIGIFLIAIGALFVKGKPSGSKGDCAANVCLGFVMDESGSVKKSNFAIMKEFVANVTEAFNIAADASRVGVITYSGRADIDFNFDRHLSNQDVSSAVGALRFSGGGTLTGAALTLAKELYAMSGPPSCTKVLIVITDGHSIDAVSGPATALKNMNVEIFSVGVGNANQAQLLEMASENRTEHTFLLKDFSGLQGLVDKLQGGVCPQPKDKLATACCEVMKAKGLCYYDYVYRLCRHTCRCQNEASDKSCKLFRDNNHCSVPEIGNYCRKSCDNCPWMKHNLGGYLQAHGIA